MNNKWNDFVLLSQGSEPEPLTEGGTKCTYGGGLNLNHIRSLLPWPNSSRLLSLFRALMSIEAGHHILLIPLYKQIHSPDQVRTNQESTQHCNERCLPHIWCSIIYSPYHHEKGMQNFMSDVCWQEEIWIVTFSYCTCLSLLRWWFNHLLYQELLLFFLFEI